MPYPGSAVSLDFTDGDTLKRFTIPDVDVGPSSEIICSIRKWNVTDRDDVGYVYLPNVVTVAAGSFDVLVTAIDADSDATTAAAEPPNEIVQLVYHILQR